MTKSGKTCQEWTSQSPHQHLYGGSLSLDRNYCRNPDNYIEPWCYTMEPKPRFEICNIPLCGLYFSTLLRLSILLEGEGGYLWRCKGKIFQIPNKYNTPLSVKLNGWSFKPQPHCRVSSARFYYGSLRHVVSKFGPV